MNKIAVIYESKYGATQIYAYWIAEALKVEVFRKSEISLTNIKKFDYLIYGAGIYNGKLNGAAFLKKCKIKPSIIFTVGIEEKPSENLSIFCNEMLPALKSRNKSQYNQIFHFPGAYNPNQLYGIDKLEILFLSKILKKCQPILLEKEDSVSLMQQYDFISKNKIEPLIQCVKAEILRMQD